MTVHISGRGVVVSPALRRHVEAKIAKVSRFRPKITEARVVLALERYRHLAELTLQVTRGTLRAEAAAGDFRAAVDLAVENLERQVRRRKDRIRTRKPRASRRLAASPVRGPSPPDPPDEEPLLVVRRTGAKPMSVEEALEQMRVRDEKLLVFTNARSRTVNVLHRRADGALELVQPGR